MTGTAPRALLALLLVGVSGCGSTPPVPALPEALDLRAVCDALLSAELVAQFDGLGAQLLSVSTDDERAALVQGITEAFRDRVEDTPRPARLQVALAFAYPASTAEHPRYHRVDLVTTLPAIPTDRWSRADSGVDAVWISQYAFPREATYPMDRPLLLQCWAGFSRTATRGVRAEPQVRHRSARGRHW